tara:strand:+ start:755 stop:892 length:138 start_codon:yes stop_codon:yes gene_type:complete
VVVLEWLQGAVVLAVVVLAVVVGKAEPVGLRVGLLVQRAPLVWDS